MAVDVMENPPILPSVEVILPVICAADAVICPVVPFNTNVSPAELDKFVPIVNPPIVPVSAFIEPLNRTLDAVIWPSEFNVKPESLDTIVVGFIVNPPMLPILELTVPLTCKVVPSNDKLEFPLFFKVYNIYFF